MLIAVFDLNFLYKLSYIRNWRLGKNRMYSSIVHKTGYRGLSAMVIATGVLLVFLSISLSIFSSETPDNNLYGIQQCEEDLESRSYHATVDILYYMGTISRSTSDCVRSFALIHYFYETVSLPSKESSSITSRSPPLYSS